MYMSERIILDTGMDRESPQAREWLSFFDKQVSPFYRAYLMPPGGEASQAAIFFLDGYAFERAGRSSSYAPAAVDALKKNAAEFDLSPSPEVEKKIWIDFSTALREAGVPPNEKRCPLWPEGDQSLVSRLGQEKLSNILAYAQECVRQGTIPEAFDFLKSIRGIGPKIASFFLRDVKELLPEGGVSVQIDTGIRWQLQPIDRWVRRTIELIGGTAMEDRETAQFIVANSANPERVNMGIWYFAALVCESQYRHELCLHTIDAARNELERFIRSKTLEYKNFLQICSEQAKTLR
jgi:hypothetical protein